jgi:hypothetical protein
VPSRRLVRPSAVRASPLRLFYPGLPPGLSPVSFRSFQTSRLHLPAPLGSTGITRLQRYYEGSDSRAWVALPLCASFHPPLAIGRAGLSTSRISPSGLSVSNHLTAPHDRFGTCPVSVAGFPFVSGLGFTLPSGARHTARPNRVRFTTDGPFASRCSPPHLAMTQLRSATGRKQVSLKGTFTSLM